jgi:hypothetical protein
VAYLFLGMPQSSFLGLALFSAPEPLYAHYVTLQRSWGPSPLVDQQWAGGLMWAGGDGFFLVAMILALWVWLRAEERAGRLADSWTAKKNAAPHHRSDPRPSMPGQRMTNTLTSTRQPLVVFVLGDSIVDRDASWHATRSSRSSIESCGA